MTIPEQPLDPPEMPEDTRPQFGTLSEAEQEDIIEEFHDKHHEDYSSYYEEAISQLPENHDHFDLWAYIARCIVNKHGEQLEWTL